MAAGLPIRDERGAARDLGQVSPATFARRNSRLTGAHVPGALRGRATSTWEGGGGKELSRRSLRASTGDGGRGGHAGRARVPVNIYLLAATDPGLGMATLRTDGGVTPAASALASHSQHQGSRASLPAFRPCVARGAQPPWNLERPMRHLHDGRRRGRAGRDEGPEGRRCIRHHGRRRGARRADGLGPFRLGRIYIKLGTCARPARGACVGGLLLF